jgi:hypothetical protein
VPASPANRLKLVKIEPLFTPQESCETYKVLFASFTVWPRGEQVEVRGLLGCLKEQGCIKILTRFQNLRLGTDLTTLSTLPILMWVQLIQRM